MVPALAQLQSQKPLPGGGGCIELLTVQGGVVTNSVYIYIYILYIHTYNIIHKHSYLLLIIIYIYIYIYISLPKYTELVSRRAPGIIFNLVALDCPSARRNTPGGINYNPHLGSRAHPGSFEPLDPRARKHFSRSGVFEPEGPGARDKPILYSVRLPHSYSKCRANSGVSSERPSKTRRSKQS